jgi:hypothetical protein
MVETDKGPVSVFIGAVLPQWADAMTGRFTAPLVIAAAVAAIAGIFGVAIYDVPLVAKTAIISPILVVLACGVLAVYKVWNIEYEKNLASERKFKALEERIKPQLRVSFDMDNFGCVRPGTEVYQRQVPIYGDNRSLTVTGIVPPHSIVPTMRVMWSEDFPKPEFYATYYRLEVECVGIESVENCFGRLESISKDGPPIRYWEPTVLPFAPSEQSDAASRRIHEGSPAFLDFMFISDDNRAGLTPLGFVGASSVNWFQILAEPGVYSMRINILSDTPTVSIDVLFKWTGDRTSSEITCREASP